MSEPRTYEFYRNALRNERLPLAFVDLDFLFANCAKVIKQAGDLPVRIATKSIRCPEILRRLLAHSPQLQGLMCYSPKEAAYLSRAGFDDILIAYPTVEKADIREALACIEAGARIVFMIDSLEHVETLSAEIRSSNTIVPVCLDLCMSVPLPGLFFGVKRSPLRTPDDALALARQLRAFPNIKLCGLMGYEAQIAGVPDRHPFKRLESLVVRYLKHSTYRRVMQRRIATADALRQDGFDIALVNGGGTGSLRRSREDTSLTELTAGSGFYAPTLFDYYCDFQLQPAAGFALPVTRRPDTHTATCHGGGYIASGGAGVDRLPTPYLPVGARLLAREGAGEVQTPISGLPPDIKIGDPVFFRHAKAGELCEHFNELVLIAGGRVEGRAKTYRGDGMSFL